MKAKAFVSLAVLLIAAGVHAETLPLNLEVGYQWVNRTGNEFMYRTQVNERSGFVIRAFSYVTPDMRLDATGMGAAPMSALRFTTGREGAYKLRVGYRSIDSYSALPAFSNPLFSQGILLSQHTYDRTRRMVDADLEFIPDRAIAPFIGFSADSNNGPSRTTYTIGQDEFLLSQHLRENNREFRAGASFKFANVSGTVTQGWRTFRSTEAFSLPGASSGNNANPILGQPTTAESIVRNDVTRVKTPFTNAYATAELGDRLTFVGNYVRFAADSTGSETESANGAFTSFAISRFFTGINETASSRAKNTTWRGGARAEFKLTDDVDFLGSYQKEHRQLTGSALLDTLFLQSVTFDGKDLRDLRDVLSASNSLNRDEVVTAAGVSARPGSGPFAFRTELRSTKQTIEANADVAEIVIPGNQGGTFNRTINTLDSTLSYAKSGWLFSANWRRDDADRPVFRSDYIDRTRLRGRAMWKAPKYLRAGVTAEWSRQTNDQSDIGLDASIRQYIGEVEFTPVTTLALRGSYSKFRANSVALFRAPQNFTTDTSRRFEDGYSNEGGFALTYPKWSFDGSLAKFKNTGSAPFNVDHYRARFTMDVKARTGLAAEWNRDKYRDFLSVANFQANRFGIFFTFR